MTGCQFLFPNSLMTWRDWDSSMCLPTQPFNRLYRKASSECLILCLSYVGCWFPSLLLWLWWCAGRASLTAYYEQCQALMQRFTHRYTSTAYTLHWPSQSVFAWKSCLSQDDRIQSINTSSVLKACVIIHKLFSHQQQPIPLPWSWVLFFSHLLHR